MSETNTFNDESVKFILIPGSNNNYQIIISDSIVSQLGGGDNININTTESDNHIMLSFNFPSDGKQKYNSLITIDSYAKNRIFINEPNPDLSIDNAVSSTFLKSIKAFIGSSFYIDLDASGKVQSMLGYEDFQKKFSDIYNRELEYSKNDDEQRPAFPVKNGIVFKESYFIDLFERISGNLPSNKVSVNTQWQKMESIDIGGPRYVLTNYTCYKIENGIAYIRSYAKVDDPISANNQSDRMTGVEEGEIEIDANTGMLIRSEKNLVLHGKTLIGKAKFSITKSKRTTIDRLSSSTNSKKPENNIMFTGAGSTIKEVAITEGMSEVKLSYEFYKDADQLIIEDQDGKKLSETPIASTNNEQSITIPIKGVRILVLKVKSLSPNSRWRIKLEYL